MTVTNALLTVATFLACAATATLQSEDRFAALSSLDDATRQRVVAVVDQHAQQPPAPISATPQNFGSYVCICDGASANVTFVNFPERDCLGAASLYTLPLNTCYPEMVTYSWNGFCNATNMWYNNFEGTTCAGTSALSRMYTTYKCFNCPNKECKNGN